MTSGKGGIITCSQTEIATILRSSNQLSSLTQIRRSPSTDITFLNVPKRTPLIEALPVARAASKPDIAVRIVDHTFHCHMHVLQYYSDFFLDLDTGTDHTELDPSKVSPRAFIIIYEWMMDENHKLKRSGILEVFEAANFLVVRQLINQCWSLFDSQLCRESCAFFLYIEAREFKKSPEMKLLKNLLFGRIQKFFLPLTVSTAFEQLPTREVSILLSSNLIGVHSELDVFLAILCWVEGNWEHRLHRVPVLMQNVRFKLIPPWFLVSLGTKSRDDKLGIFVNIPEVSSMIKEAVMYNAAYSCKSSNRENFLGYLANLKIEVPIHRRWVRDTKYNFYDELERSLQHDCSYNACAVYLKRIQNAGPSYEEQLDFIDDRFKSFTE